jgi:hypothetical protein
MIKKIILFSITSIIKYSVQMMTNITNIVIIEHLLIEETQKNTLKKLYAFYIILKVFVLEFGI